MFDNQIQQIKRGVVGGLAGGAVFGMMMAKMGMLPMIGKMVGQPHAVAGFAVHLLISAMIGASYGLLTGTRRFGTPLALATGGAYGMVWWFLGPLTLMPLFMGMGLGVNWNLTAAENTLPSLMGHVIFGIILGLVVRRLAKPGEKHEADPRRASNLEAV